MKNFLKVLIIAVCFVLYFNVNSFAIVDAAAWLGVVGGHTDPGPGDGDYLGILAGIKGHYNMALVPLVELGVGLFAQASNGRYDLVHKEKVHRKIAGFDTNLILTIPIIHPYLRGTWAFYDKVEDSVKRFKTLGGGGGIEFGILFIRVFGEYMYEKSNHKHMDIAAKTFNLGLKLSF